VVNNSYKTMLDCWNSDPHQRPTFSLLVSCLDSMLSTAVGQVLLYAFYSMLLHIGVASYGALSTGARAPPSTSS